MRHIAILVCMAILLFLACKDQPKNETMHTLFVGTYTDGESEGIYQYSFDTNDGSLTQGALVAKLPNPSYLTISNDGKHLYAVQETADFDSLGGGVTAFKFDNGVLGILNSMGSQGAHPCHISLSEDGRLAVSNYTGGNVSIFKLDQDGALVPDPQVIEHKAIDSLKVPHAHMAQFTQDGLFVADLGLSAVMRYQNDGGKFVPSEQKALALPDGAGSRHFTFNKDENMLYVINELNATIVVFEKNTKDDYLPVQTVKTLDDNYNGANSCADIHLSPDGRFLYGSNRGENTIVIFSVDEVSGTLSLVGRNAVEGEWPRNFSLDPSGQFLLVANQYSNNIVVFKRDGESGNLEFSGETKIANPVCLKFFPN
ncbi:beta-propeller fold lactonase family protein [Muricauda sp. JGD-17]|uniref:Beta-propeller fold lactonase family protein n=1 Tax=Flagellimonas ochracea TaxID=2696472 RepID=A0A964WX59_9FLAO|nr:lactonase family protein [Allomuricauda ochracea]NAY91522.1 beta-propeller fold lactonase family protein [Allomuricauda ochracea]